MLSTAGDDPHAIPVSTAVRAADDLVLVALATRRESLTRLRADPRAALTLLGEDDVAITAHCRARIVADPMSISDRLCAVALDVLRVQDHGQPRFEIDAGVRWHWTDEQARRRDHDVRRALSELAWPRP